MRLLRRVIFLLALSLIASSQLGGGCASDSSPTSPSNPNYGNPGGNTGDVDRPNRIPRSADLMREGIDKLKWTADLDGQFYVYDVEKDRIIYSGPVQRGQEIVVVPRTNEIFVNQVAVYNKDVRKSAVHRIYFAANRQSGGRDDATGGTPTNATILAQGKGNLKIDQAPFDGTVFVYDNKAARIVYETKLKRGNSFQIFPEKNYVNVNSKKAADVRLDSKAHFTLYFRHAR